MLMKVIIFRNDILIDLGSREVSSGKMIIENFFSFLILNIWFLL